MVYMSECGQREPCNWRSEDNLLGVGSLLQSKDRGWTQVVRLSKQTLPSIEPSCKDTNNFLDAFCMYVLTLPYRHFIN